MSRYQPYPTYKESGVEWLGDVPEHWEIKRNRFVFHFSKGLTITKENLQDDGVPCISYGEVHSKYGFEFNPRANDLKCVSEEYLKSSKNCLLQQGDFVFADTSEDYEGAGNFSYLNAEIRTFAGYHTIIARASSEINPRFCAFVFDSAAHRAQIQTAAKGIKVFSISQAILKDASSWFPPLTEQTAIANFLDRETAKIDTLIAKQERMIELLNEKRSALISHAVTKGLNPNARMKDSGVEWLGEVPEHWEIKRSKYIFRIKKIIAGELGYQVLSITQKGIKVKDTESGTGQLSMDYSKYQLVKEGDYAMNHMDLLTGYVDISKYDGVTSPDYRVFSLEDKNSCSQYFLYLLQNGYKRKIFFAFGQGSSQIGRWRFPTEQFVDFQFPYPPLEEQVKISEFIQQSELKIEALIEKAQKAIHLMKERRTALISAAVTGKIDVRGMV